MSPDPAGYDERERIEEELPKLSQRQRCAFAAACAGRVIPVVKGYFTEDARCEAAVELTWRFACGEAFDRTEAKKLLDELEELVEELHDDDETGATLRAVYAASSALESTIIPESEPAYGASCEAEDAADGDMTDGDRHIQEEASWQLQAFDIAAKTKSPTRDMFSSIDTEPAWLQAFRRRDA